MDFGQPVPGWWRASESQLFLPDSFVRVNTFDSPHPREARRETADG
jgi:hypothetical protein